MLTPDDIFKANRDLAIRKKSDRARYNTFTPRRVDKNQAALVKAFRQLGVKWTHLHMVGAGVWDGLAGFKWLTVIVEIKDGSKPPSARKLTEQEMTWGRTWPGLKTVVCNTDDVQRVAACMKLIVAHVDKSGFTPKVFGNAERQYDLTVPLGFFTDDRP